MCPDSNIVVFFFFRFKSPYNISSALPLCRLRLACHTNTDRPTQCRPPRLSLSCCGTPNNVIFKLDIVDQRIGTGQFWDPRFRLV